MEYQIEQQARGTRIITGDETKERRSLLNKMIAIAETNGFEEIILPTIEPSSIYIDKAGNEILNQMYVFPDKKGRELCLRPEVTATIQKFADHFLQTNKEKRLWYFERCYRYERPQAGRYREFYQFGLEIINPKEKNYDGLLIDIATEMIKLKTNDLQTNFLAKRGLDYYTNGQGFEISCSQLGSQKQVCGGGSYKQGIGFAIGFDRLMLCK
jgi:histidyl-tRNA synthetase